MQINLADIARGRRIVAIVAREMSRTRSSARPSRMQRTISRLLRTMLR